MSFAFGFQLSVPFCPRLKRVLALPNIEIIRFSQDYTHPRLRVTISTGIQNRPTENKTNRAQSAVKAHVIKRCSIGSGT